MQAARASMHDLDFDIYFSPCNPGRPHCRWESHVREAFCKFHKIVRGLLQPSARDSRQAVSDSAPADAK